MIQIYLVAYFMEEHGHFKDSNRLDLIIGVSLMASFLF